MGEVLYQAVFNSTTPAAEIEERMKLFNIYVEDKEANKYTVKATKLNMHRFADYPPIKYYAELEKVAKPLPTDGAWLDESRII